MNSFKLNKKWVFLCGQDRGNVRGTIAFIKFEKRFGSLKLGRSTKLRAILHYRVNKPIISLEKNKKPRKQKNKKQRLPSCQLNSLAIQNWTVEGAVPYMKHLETVLPRPLTSKGILELQVLQTNSRPTQSKNLHFNENHPPPRDAYARKVWEAAL